MPDSGVKFLWICLPGFMELECDLSVHAEGEVVVDHVEGRVVNTLCGDSLSMTAILREGSLAALVTWHGPTSGGGGVAQGRVGRGLQPPPVQPDHVRVLDGEQQLAGDPGLDDTSPVSTIST